MSLEGRRIAQITLSEFLKHNEGALRLGPVKFSVVLPSTGEKIVYRIIRDVQPTEHDYPEREQ